MLWYYLYAINLCIEVPGEVSFCISPYKIQLFFPCRHCPLHSVFRQWCISKQVLKFLLGMGFTVVLQIMSHARFASPELNQIHSREEQQLLKSLSMDRLSARLEDKPLHFPKVLS